MSIGSPKDTILAAGTGPAAAGETSGKAVGELLARIKDSSPDVRTQAWLGAGGIGAAAVRPLSGVMTDQDLEIARAAKRALWKIVHHAGRSGAQDEKRAVASELIELLGEDAAVPVRREILWMLSEIGEREAVQPMARLLANEDLREDARMTLERIPGRRSLTAIRTAFEAAREDFKSNLAQSLRRRGETIPGYPCEKLVPRRKTEVKSLE